MPVISKSPGDSMRMPSCLQKCGTIKSGLLKLGKNDFLPAIVRHTEEEMERRNWIQVKLHLEALTAADRDRSGAVGVGDVGVVGERIGHVERSIYGWGVGGSSVGGWSVRGLAIR